MLLGYFGEAAGPCGNCDLCDRPAQLFDATEAVRKALSAILRTGEWFGAGHLIDVLTGTATPKVREKGHDQLPTFAVGRDLVRPDPERHGALRMTEAARPVLRGEAQVTLRRDTIAALQAHSRRPLVLRQVPIREGGEVTGYVDLVSERAYRWRRGEEPHLFDPETEKAILN